MQATATTGELAINAPDAAQQSQWSRPSVRLTALFMTLTCLGLVASASAASAEDYTPALLRRLAFTGAGLCAFIFGAGANYQWWRRHHLAALALAFAGVAAVFVPHVGMQINGARRWINPGLPVGFQPSEFAKVALLIWVAAYCERNAGRMRSFAHGFLVPVGVVGLICLPILAEPDFGTAVLTGGVCTVVLLVFGTRLVYVLLAGAAAMPLLQRLIFDVPYRMQRLLAFMHPWRDPRGAGYQLIQSKIAIGSGGLFGVGLGAGHQKAGFLPGAGNDFIFSVLAEELGLIGSLVVVTLFLFVLWECLKVVMRTRDPFGFSLAVGLSWLLTAQAAAHIAVATGSVPTKGLSLPFMSAGGSSLMASMLAAGILVSIARSVESPESYPLKPWDQDRPAYERLASAGLDHLARAAGTSTDRLN